MNTAAGRPPSGASRHRRVFLPVLAGLAALAWISLWAWARSPYGRYLEHGDWTASGPAAFLCRAVPAGDLVVPIVLYAVAWILMTTAMMLPTTLPLFNSHRQWRLWRAMCDGARSGTHAGGRIPYASRSFAAGDTAVKSATFPCRRTSTCGK